MSQITTHILNTTLGKPAAYVNVALYSLSDNFWAEIATGKTNSDGRLPGLLADDVTVKPGVYKLRFETKPYFDSMEVKSFYPFIEITFSIEDDQHYHVPLLLNPFGYSTYRGS